MNKRQEYTTGSTKTKFLTETVNFTCVDQGNFIRLFQPQLLKKDRNYLISTTRKMML